MNNDLNLRSTRDVDIVKIRRNGEDTAYIEFANGNWYTVNIEELLIDWLELHKENRKTILLRRNAGLKFVGENDYSIGLSHYGYVCLKCGAKKSLLDKYEKTTCDIDGCDGVAILDHHMTAYDKKTDLRIKEVNREQKVIKLLKDIKDFVKMNPGHLQHAYAVIKEEIENILTEIDNGQ